MSKSLKASYQCDQGGWPFVLLTYKKWKERVCVECAYDTAGIEEAYHHLSAQDARELAKELLKIADKIEKEGA